MGKIKKLHQGALVGEGSSEEVYPVTAAQAVYHSDGSDLETLIDNATSDANWAAAANSYYRNSQAGNVAAKVITTYKNMDLRGGGSLKVTFEQVNTANDATLNIDGTGAKPLYYNGARVSSTNSWEANETVEIYYNNYNSGAYHAKRWMVKPVSVSQNTETDARDAMSISVGSDKYNVRDSDIFKKCSIARGKNLYDKSQKLIVGRIESDGHIDTSITALRVTDFIPVIGGTNYVFLSTTGITVNGSGYIAFYDENFNYISTQKPDSTHLYFTTPANCVYVRCTIHSDYLNVNVQLEQGTTKTSFEPYDDIATKPSINDIKSVIANINNALINRILTVSLAKCNIARGKNLYDKNQNLTVGRIESDGHIDTSITALRVTNFIPVENNTNYVFLSTGGIPVNGSGYIAFYDNDFDFISTIKPDSSQIYFTTPANCVYVRCSIHSDYLNVNVQLEQGTTKTSFEPYDDIATKPSIESLKNNFGNLDSRIEAELLAKLNIYPNKNLYDKNQNLTVGRIESDGTINPSATALYATNFIPVEGNSTYVITEQNGWYVGSSGYIAYFDKDLNLLGTVLPTNNNLPFTTPQGCAYIRCSIHSDYLNNKIQLEKGSARTFYVEYDAFGYWADKIASLENQTTLLMPARASKMINPKLDYNKAELKILDIGNSHSFDSMHYLSRVVNAQNVDTSDIGVFRLARGGSSFKSWYDCWHNNDNSAYYVCKEIGSLNAVVDAANIPTYPQKIDGVANDGTLMQKVLTQNLFDVIFIHASFEYQDDWSVWEGNGNGGYLKELIRLIRTYQPKATIGYLFTHAPWGISGSTLVGTANKIHKFAESIEQFCAEYGVDLVIPAGMALENIRQSVEIDASEHHGLNYDKASPLHCGFGVATYTTACAWYEAMLAPRYGKSILGNTYRTVVTEEGGIIKYDGENIPQGENSYTDASIPVTNDNAELCQLAAICAVNDMWNIINPDDIVL